MPITTDSSPVKGDKSFTCADLPTIAFDKLVDRDPQELAKLLADGKKEGFSYLDLMKPESKGLYDDYETVLSVMKTWFDQPLKEKVKYAYGSDTQGYHIAQTGLTWAEKPLPPTVLKNHALFDAFISKTRFHVIELLTCFSDSLASSAATDTRTPTATTTPSNSSMAFHRYPKQDATRRLQRRQQQAH
ncbi:MAG: hypothetical protein Q9208_005982 [Pyrenodesmia sp. 3 TL-2023]